MLRDPHGRVQGDPQRIRVHRGLETRASFACYRSPTGVASHEFGARFRFTTPCWSGALLHCCPGLFCTSSDAPLFLPSRLLLHRCPIISRLGPPVLHHGRCKHGVPTDLIELLLPVQFSSRSPFPGRVSTCVCVLGIDPRPSGHSQFLRVSCYCSALPTARHRWCVCEGARGAIFGKRVRVLVVGASAVQQVSSPSTPPNRLVCCEIAPSGFRSWCFGGEVFLWFWEELGWWSGNERWGLKFIGTLWRDAETIGWGAISATTPQW